MPRRLPELEYPAGVLARRVQNHGDIYYRDQRFFLSEIFASQPVGLRPVDDRYLETFYDMVRLGWLDLEQNRLSRQQPRKLEREKPETEEPPPTG
jgi:hypothetical protein